MQLLEIYENYKAVNKEYISWIEELVEKDFQGYTEDEIKAKLEEARQSFTDMMEQSNELEIGEEQEVNYKDLRYLVMDALFLASDLAHFYQYQELGRFKMRVINCFNKKKREAVFGGQPGNRSCPVL